ncbi:CHAT domain-containing protein [Aquimarina algiphila]|uniref:CHAT domain-containing protein n=1 Tax=Aquimarina algiphila TaxID=2047982 RepID=A0A554VC50_9FLAO|nr:CHAT domain-containing tetratricopeptide repeat protein [Aquimarina algiphila]TSE04239.1 CHAT domain-containing protein [Aquimarina algiphila]
MKTLHSISFVFIIFFMIICHTAHAQVEKDTLLASQYFKKGDSLLIDAKYGESIKLFRKALPIYKEIKAWEKVASCYNKISENQWRKYDDEESLINAKKALKTSSKYLKNNIEEAIAYGNIGVYHRYSLDYETAIENYNKALTIKQKIAPKPYKEISVSYGRIGTIFLLKGEYDKSLLFLKRALSLGIKVYGKSHKNIGYSYNEIGRVYISKKEYEKALDYFKKALTIFSNKTNLQIEAASSLNNIGVALRGKKKYYEALKYYNRALDIYLKVYAKEHVRVSNSYYNIGLIHHDLKEYENALEYYNKALTIRLTKLGKNHSYVANSYFLMGWSYYEKHEYENSLIHYKKSLDINLKLSSPNPTMIATLYHFTGDIFNRKGEYHKALHYYQLALEANTLINKTNKNNVNQFFDLNIALEISLNQAKAFQKLYQQDNNLKDLQQSINTYKKADTLIHKIRQELSKPKDKLEFAKITKEVYTGAIETELLFNTIHKKHNDLNNIFYYLEQSKANILKELLNNSSAINFAGLSVELVELEKSLKTDLSFYQSRVNKEQAKSQLDTLKIRKYENKLFDINRRQDSLTQILEKNYPKYHQLKYQNDIVSVTDIQQQLDDKTTVLEFFTGDNISYAFTISKHNITVKELSTPKLTEQVEAFRKSIIDQDVRSYKKQANILYQKLIAPIVDELIGDELIIVPDGPLWHLNFDLLLTQKDDSNNPALLSYLLNDYAITYANSANLLFAPFTTNKQSEILQECLAFSFSDSTQTTATNTVRLATLRDAGGDLPGTREEIRAIADIIDGQYYYGSQAVESNFKNNASRYNILHLALHGEVDNERPENSKLYFTKSKDTIEDNLLYSHELFALDIPAELTVLSACNTGAGKIAKGEGIMSLGNAFQYAGTKSLLLTNWEVSDKTTPDVMKYFYINLKAGMNKGKALQQAKLQYLATADINRTAPFYWGAFYLVGDAAPMHFENNTLVYWAMGLGVLGIIILVGFWYRRKNKV